MVFYRKIVVYFFQAFYYLVARNLPGSYSFSILGPLSKKCRVFACKQFFRSIGCNVNIDHGAYFGSGRLIEIGNNSAIGTDCRVPANIRIGNDVMMGPEVIIINQNQTHRFDDCSKPMRLQGHEDTQPVMLEGDVWLGTRVIIMPGIKIGKGAVIGAGTIVTKDVPPYAICVGNPARVVRFRNDTKE